MTPAARNERHVAGPRGRLSSPASLFRPPVILSRFVILRPVPAPARNRLIGVACRLRSQVGPHGAGASRADGVDRIPLRPAEQVAPGRVSLLPRDRGTAAL